MRVLAAAFVVAQLLDSLTFLRMIEVAGLQAEINPIASHLAHEGLAVAIAAKALVAAFGLAVVAAIVRSGKYRPAAELVLITGILVGAFGAGSNVTVVGAAEVLR